MTDTNKIAEFVDEIEAERTNQEAEMDEEFWDVRKPLFQKKGIIRGKGGGVRIYDAAIYDNVLCNYRLEALKIATDIALKINHFEHQYSDGMPGLLKDIDLLHEIADHNLKYIMGEE